MHTHFHHYFHHKPLHQLHVPPVENCISLGCCREGCKFTSPWLKNFGFTLSPRAVSTNSMALPVVHSKISMALKSTSPKSTRLSKEVNELGSCSTTSMEILPHVRRREGEDLTYGEVFGNTSACAEKSHGYGAPIRRWWKYLRVCGEESWRKYPSSPCTEIPPHVRRRVFRQPKVSGEPGNTSACAEKSYWTISSWLSSGKYLRVCGEEAVNARTATCTVEIPPRVRRRVGT